MLSGLYRPRSRRRLANLTDDVEWRLIGGFADLMGSEFRGPEEVRQLLA